MDDGEDACTSQEANQSFGPNEPKYGRSKKKMRGSREEVESKHTRVEREFRIMEKKRE